MQGIRLLALALTVPVVFAAAGAAATRDSQTTARPTLRELAQGMVAAGAPGALVYVRDAGGSRAGTAGYANLRTRERLETEHLFRVGSITKTFVATVVLQLQAEGVLRLDDVVDRWLPGLVPKGRSITLRQLLNHTSGLYDYTQDDAFIRRVARSPRAAWTPEALVRVATGHRPSFPPGSAWSYSSTGYIVLGLVIEKAAGRSLAAELARRIFKPLALARTSLPAGPALAPPFARGYLPPGSLIPTPRGRPADITAWNPSSAWAAGAIVSTARDLARFYAALLGGKLLAPVQLRALKQTVPGSDDYGLGIRRGKLPCASAWGHGGSVPGYRTLAYSSSDGSRQAIVMVNGMSVADSDLGARFGAALESAFCR